MFTMGTIGWGIRHYVSACTMSTGSPKLAAEADWPIENCQHLV